jgi:predicted phosphodiesterase
LFLNPGSAVQPRYGYPAAVALLRIKGNAAETRFIELKE